MKAYKTIVLVCALVGILTLFGIIAATAFGKVAFDVGMLLIMGTAFIDLVLLYAAKEASVAEVKIAHMKARDTKGTPRVEVG